MGLVQGVKPAPSSSHANVLPSLFDVKAKVDKVNLTEYFRYKSPALADAVAGRISGDIDLAGHGKTWEALQKTLTGRGGAVVLEGALLNTNLTEQLFNGFAASPLVPPTVIAPAVRRRSPAISVRSVVLPQPDGPMIDHASPSRTCQLKSWKIGTPRGP